MRAYIGLGTNLGDRQRTLETAIAALDEMPGVRVVAVSRLYRTRPVGPKDQPDYLNAAVAVDVAVGHRRSIRAAIELLGRLKEVEARSGRRPRGRWGPRELDLDLLAFGRQAISVTEPELTVPHRLAGERLFVLAPLRDLAPRLRPPGWPEDVARTYRKRLAVEGPDAVCLVGRWDPTRGGWVRRSPRPAGRAHELPVVPMD